MDEKNSASAARPALDALSEVASESLTASIITQNSIGGQAVAQGTAFGCQEDDNVSYIGRRSKKKSTPGLIPIGAVVYAASIKIYDEQLMYGWDMTQQMIKSIDKEHYEVIAICHDQDTYADGDVFWKTAIEKRHFHIIFRCTNSQKKRVRLSTMLNKLGVRFRVGLDEDLYKHHGVEGVGDFSHLAVYLTHETEQAIRDGKYLYDMSCLVSNLSPDEIQTVRDGYMRLGAAKNKLTPADWEHLDEQAYKLGYEFKDFTRFVAGLPFSARGSSKQKLNALQDSYDRGVEDRVKENSSIVRTCVFIHGKANLGKSFAAKKALSGLNVLTVEGGGTGKFDNLLPDTDVILINDDTCPNLKTVADNYCCRVYRRGSNNPVWAGSVLIVTSNYHFDEWVQSCGVKVYVGNTREHTEDYNAVRSRFTIGQIETDKNGVSNLIFESVSCRGTKEERQARVAFLMQFKDRYNEVISKYKPEGEDDFDDAVLDLIAPEFLPADKIFQRHPGTIMAVLHEFCNYFWHGTSNYSPWPAYIKKSKPTVPAGDIYAVTKLKLNFLNGMTDNDLTMVVGSFGNREYKRSIIDRFDIKVLRKHLERDAQFVEEDLDYGEYDPLTEDQLCSGRLQ